MGLANRLREGGRVKKVGNWLLVLNLFLAIVNALASHISGDLPKAMFWLLYVIAFCTCFIAYKYLTKEGQ